MHDCTTSKPQEANNGLARATLVSAEIAQATSADSRLGPLQKTAGITNWPGRYGWHWAHQSGEGWSVDM
eukprot:6960871-Alexandrium_andersonii.AAC.1